MTDQPTTYTAFLDNVPADDSQMVWVHPGSGDDVVYGSGDQVANEYVARDDLFDAATETLQGLGFRPVAGADWNEQRGVSRVLVERIPTTPEETS